MLICYKYRKIVELVCVTLTKCKETKIKKFAQTKNIKLYENDLFKE